jgi:hypothetical protein
MSSRMLDERLMVYYPGQCLRPAVTLLVLVSFLTGCAPSISQRYYPSAKNAIALRALAAQRAETLTVGRFRGGPETVWCRGAGISPPDRKSFAEFLRGAFIDELALAGLLTEASPLEFRANLKFLDVECNVGTGIWTIEFEYSIAEGPPAVVKKDYEFEGAYLGETVYRNAVQALVPAVQELIQTVVTSNDFRNPGR